MNVFYLIGTLVGLALSQDSGFTGSPTPSSKLELFLVWEETFDDFVEFDHPTDWVLGNVSSEGTITDTFSLEVGRTRDPKNVTDKALHLFSRDTTNAYNGYLTVTFPCIASGRQDFDFWIIANPGKNVDVSGNNGYTKLQFERSDGTVCHSYIKIDAQGFRSHMACFNTNEYFGPSLKSNQWYHVRYEFEPTKGVLEIYIDDKYYQTLTMDNSLGPFIRVTAIEFQMYKGRDYGVDDLQMYAAACQPITTGAYVEHKGYSGVGGADIGTCGYPTQAAIEESCDADKSCKGYSKSTGYGASKNDGSPWWCLKSTSELGDYNDADLSINSFFVKQESTPVPTTAESTPVPTTVGPTPVPTTAGPTPVPTTAGPTPPPTQASTYCEREMGNAPGRTISCGDGVTCKEVEDATGWIHAECGEEPVSQASFTTSSLVVTSLVIFGALH